MSSALQTPILTTSMGHDGDDDDDGDDGEVGEGWIRLPPWL
jgi:hypothetical protein